jgi:hypothetical protein
VLQEVQQAEALERRIEQTVQGAVERARDEERYWKGVASSNFAHLSSTVPLPSLSPLSCATLK